MIGISDGRNVIFRTEEVEGGNGEGRIAISHLLQCPAIYIRYDRMHSQASVRGSRCSGITLWYEDIIATVNVLQY